MGKHSAGVPNTISDRLMASLQRRACEANPHLASPTDPRAVRRRLADVLQRSKAASN